MATLVHVLAAGIHDNSGEALAGGQVYFYRAGTTSPVTVYQDPLQNAAHPNPATLDSAGRLVAYASQKIKIRVEDTNGSLVIEIDDIPTGATTADIAPTTGADADNYSGETLSEVLQDAATSLGNDFLYKYKTIGETRTYLSRGQDRISVKDFGAVGDGTTEDTAAIQAAVDAFPTGACIYFPVGDYLISSAITIDTPNLCFQGEGLSSRIFGTTHFRYFDLYEGANDVRFQNLFIEGPGGASLANPSYGIFAEASNANRCMNLQVVNCKVSGFGYVGIELRYCEGARIINCVLTDFYVASVQGRSVFDVEVAHCYIKDINGAAGNAYGVTFTVNSNPNLTTDPLSADCRMIGNYVENCTNWAGLDTHAGQNIVFANNVVKDCYFGILMGPQETSDYSASYCICDGNVIIGSGDGLNSYGITMVGRSTGVGSTLDWHDGSIVSNNTIYGHGNEDVTEGCALFIYATKGCIVSGNTFHLSGSNAINMSFDNRAITITGNTFRDVYSSTNTNAAGIRIQNGDNSGIIGNNTFFADTSPSTYNNVHCIYENAGTGLSTNLRISENSNVGFTNYKGGNNSTDQSRSTNNYRKPHRWEASVAPTAGAYLKGDFLYNNDPDQMESAKFLNISAGSPGTFVSPYLVRNNTVSGTNPHGVTSGSRGDIQWRSSYAQNFPLFWICDGSTEWYEIAPVFINRLYNSSGSSALTIDLATVDLSAGNNNDSILIKADVIAARAGSGAETYRVVWHANQSGGTPAFTTPIVTVLDDNITAAVTGITASWFNVGTNINKARITQGAAAAEIIEVRFNYVDFNGTRVTAIWPS